MGIPIGLSTASVFPENLAAAFALAGETGYDGIEVLVQGDPSTQSADALNYLIDTHQLPVLSIHSPCLLITASVWSTDPLVKLSRSVELAERVGAQVVVTHPPFVWQRSAAANFDAAVMELQSRTDVVIAVENMFPISVAGRRINSFRPHWDPSGADHAHFTLDLSHTASSDSDALEMLQRMGNRLDHVHLTDGSGAARDEHLVPGRGTQPGAQVLQSLVARPADGPDAFAGAVILEISTRSVGDEQRRVDLADSLAFARTHLGGQPHPLP